MYCYSFFLATLSPVCAVSNAYDHIVPLLDYIPICISDDISHFIAVHLTDDEEYQSTLEIILMLMFYVVIIAVFAVGVLHEGNKKKGSSNPNPALVEVYKETTLKQLLAFSSTGGNKLRVSKVILQQNLKIWELQDCHLFFQSLFL